MSTDRLSRRGFLKMTALTAGVALVAACAPQTAPAGETGGEAPMEEGALISWWYGWGNLMPAVDTIRELDEFKAATNNAQLEHKGSVAGEAILTAIAAGDPPDGGSNFDYPNFWTRGAVLPVNDYVSASTAIDQNDIIEVIWDSAFYDGQMIGVPGIESYLWWGLNYNADAVEKAGLDPDTPPVTWDDVYEWHEALTEFDSQGSLLQMGLDPYDAMAGETDFAATSWGFQWWDEENKTFDFDNEMMADSFETMGDFIRLAGPDNFAGLRQVEGQGGWGAAYNAGVQNMIIEGYWHPGETQIQKPEVAQYNRSTWAPVPTGREGAKIMATGAHFVQLFKDGANPDGMFSVAEFLHSNQALDIIFDEVGWIFGRKSWLETVDPNAYPGLAFYLEAPSEATEWIIGRRCPIHGYVQDQYVQLREDVYRGNMSGAEAATELQTRTENEWAAQGLS